MIGKRVNEGKRGNKLRGWEKRSNNRHTRWLNCTRTRVFSILRLGPLITARPSFARNFHCGQSCTALRGSQSCHNKQRTMQPARGWIIFHSFAYNSVTFQRGDVSLGPFSSRSFACHCHPRDLRPWKVNACYSVLWRNEISKRENSRSSALFSSCSVHGLALMARNQWFGNSVPIPMPF